MDSGARKQDLEEKSPIEKSKSRLFPRHSYLHPTTTKWFTTAAIFPPNLDSVLHCPLIVTGVVYVTFNCAIFLWNWSIPVQQYQDTKIKLLVAKVHKKLYS